MKIAACVPKMMLDGDSDAASSSWLIYMLSCHECCDAFLLTDRVTSWCLSSMRKELLGDRNVAVIVPLVRFFTNVCAANDRHAIALLNEEDFPQLVDQLLNASYEPICKETLMLVGNVVNSPNGQIQAVLDVVDFRGFVGKSVARVSMLL